MKPNSSRPHRQNSTNGGQRRTGQRGGSGSATSSTGSVNNSFSRQQHANESEKSINDKLVHLVANSVGRPCIVTVTSGARYLGLLLSADLSSSDPAIQGGSPSPLSVIIQNPRLFSKALIDEPNKVDSLPEKLIIQSKDLMDLEVQDVDLSLKSGTSTTSNSTATSSKFKTDTDISGKGRVKERELQRWVPDDDSAMLTLEDDGGHWDQFKVNEEKFGVESTYDEHLYTTRIDTSAPDYQDKLKYAERLAKEIEGQVTSDPHMLEERGIEVDDSGVDEEDKYSGVDRRGDELMAALRNASISKGSEVERGPGKYVPPRQRAAQYHDDPAIIASSATIQKNKDHESSKANKPDSIPAKPQVGQVNESFRLNAQSEINSLREFSANFKIPHKLPQDLLPILSKDKLKQDEIVKKQVEEQAKKDELLKKEQQNSGKSSASVTPVPSSTPAPRKKMDPTKPAFKLNPNAASFTPSKTQLAPAPPSSNYNKSPNNPSPRINHQRPYSGNTSSGSLMSTKRHHHISASDFFGGADKVPTKKGQEKKVKDFKLAFNMFFTVKEKSEEKTGPVLFERTFITPPTWESTVDETHDRLFPSPNGANPPTPVIPGAPTLPYLPGPMMGAPNGNPGNMMGGYPGSPGKFPMSPQQQHQQQVAAAAMAAAHFQQQQFQAAMMYQQQHQQQQFGGGIPPGQPHMQMYGPNGEPAFLPPGGFMGGAPGNFVGPGSPVNGQIVMSPTQFNPGSNGADGNSNNPSKHSGNAAPNYQNGGRKIANNNHNAPTGSGKKARNGAE
ncbi:PAB1-binding protein 1 [[Candida] anglica]|uniref:PAB1-binding protein 1 n=1 Tax=[Candida] anglica TaxID=148631 RepID=A0ABP0EB67_9ASCO